VASTLTWLDSSRDDQRRMRELINMFSDTESRDELGIGQVRDAFSDTLFPGTSSIHARARYFLIVPWCSQEAGRKGLRSNAFASRVDRNERTVIEALKKSADSDNMVGKVAGIKVRTLPSSIYAAALLRYGIRTADDAGISDIVESHELTERRIGPWHPTMPPPPPGFPATLADGLTLTPSEAHWLRERVLTTAPDTLLAYLLERGNRPDPVGEDPWSEAVVADAPAKARADLDHARRFSLAIRGAALLYNLLIAEKYELDGFTEVDSPVSRYREGVAEWAGQVANEHALNGWDRDDMWRRVIAQNPRIAHNIPARTFIDRWLDVINAQTADLADNDGVRRLVEGRERFVKGAQSRLVNTKLLRTWSGHSGSRRLTFRWPQVRRMIIDIHDGLDRTASEVTDAAA
jgi:hypothetical protein